MTKTSRAEIIAVARDLMRDKGYAGTSMKDIADRVGLLKGSLYSHFTSKEELVPEVLSFTYHETFGALTLSGNWRDDYILALDQLVTMLTVNRRCVGFHLAYGVDEAPVMLRQAVRVFFSDMHALLKDLLCQGLDADLAEAFALETIAAVEGATLWLALFDNDAPLQAAKGALLLRAESFAAETPDEAVCRLLNQLMGDWRRATLTEKRLARRTIDAEGDLLTAKAAWVGQFEAASCFL